MEVGQTLVNGTGHIWLVAAAALALGNSVWGLYSLKQGPRQENRFSDLILLAAFICQFVFLANRGRQLGHCPFSNLFEVGAFLTWSLLLTYLVIGPAYRISIMGQFTAPLVFLFDLFILVLPIDSPTLIPAMTPALELHASVTILAYGPLGLAAIAGALYLILERQLKEHSVGAWFYSLPAMGDIAVVLRRLIYFGFFLLTVGMIAGVFVAVGQSMDWVKFGWSVLVWLMYLLIVVTPNFSHFSVRRTSWCAVMSYLLIVLTFWGINSLSHQHRFGL